jgi:hypothetical protein
MCWQSQGEKWLPTRLLETIAYRSNYQNVVTISGATWVLWRLPNSRLTPLLFFRRLESEIPYVYANVAFTVGAECEKKRGNKSLISQNSVFLLRNRSPGWNGSPLR